MKQAVTETGDLVWRKDEDGRLKPQMKRDRCGGADWVETQKAVLQEMMLKELGWDRFYKGFNPRGNLILSDYRREKAPEMAKEEERQLSVRILNKNVELNDVMRNLADKNNELDEVKLEKAYDFMRQFTINGMNMLEHFLWSIGEWVQQKVAGMSR